MDLLKLIEEKQELDILIEKGITFDVGGKKYAIHEPTLRTLDTLAAEYLKIEIENTMLKDIDNADKLLKDGCKVVAIHCKRMARIVAIAVLGNKAKGKELEDLTNEMLDVLTPSKLEGIFKAVQLLMNTGAFLNSIRLTCEMKAALPALIEQDKKG